MPPTASQTQIRETRKAFYAGAIALFSILLGKDLDHQEKEPTANDLKVMDEINEELINFTLGR